MHLDVPEAVQVRADLRARARDRHALGHVRIARRRAARRAAGGAGPAAAERGLAPDQFDVLKIGETRRLERVAARPVP